MARKKNNLIFYFVLLVSSMTPLIDRLLTRIFFRLSLVIVNRSVEKCDDVQLERKKKYWETDHEESVYT